MYNTAKNIGDLEIVMFSRGLTFTPAEIDTSIRPGWFWHDKEDPRSLETLYNIYVNSVGGNCCLNLNVPPNRDGLIDERDVKRLRELGDLIRERLGSEIPTVLKEQNPLLFGKSNKELDHLVLRITSARGEVFLKSVKVY